MNRNKLIKELSEVRKGSRVITYITSDRKPPFNARMAIDIIRPFSEHLQRICRTGQIDLLIYSAGGDTIVPWRLVNLIREFCDKFCVLIPYKALSAATLLALGADEVVMSPLGELSPIDPMIGTPFNPPHPDNPNERKVEISVEDVVGYINLAKERVGITNQDNLVHIYNKLSERLHPLSIGAVYRSHALIRLLAGKLLSMHMTGKRDSKRISRIVNDLAEKLYYHSYLINRKEAKELGLNIVETSKETEDKMWQLYLSYEKEMELTKTFDPSTYPAGQERKTVIGFIESMGLSTKYEKCITVNSISGPSQPGVAPSPQYAIKEQAIGWVTEETREEE